MANKIVKGLAIAAGTGLAIGLGNKRSHPAVPVVEPAIDPLEQRLGRIESRLSAVESRPAQPPDFAAIEARFESQEREIAALQKHMAETREKVAATGSVIERLFADVAEEVPGMVASVISSRVAQLRNTLTAEIQQAVDARLVTFERTIDDKVSGRVAALEKALVDQSGVITALSQRALESDANLQRLISAVEKLCERTEGRPAAAAQPREDAPFEKHLDDAIKRPPVSGFRPAIVKEDEELRPRHRLSGYRGL